MQRLATSLRPLRHLGMMGSKPSRSASISSRFKSCAVVPDEPELGEFLDYMEKLKNYETVGVPQGAGTDTDDGFDLGRMRRLLQRLGNPHKQFKVFTALAYLLFSEERVDIAVIEAGLGGARDATNVICSTELAASVITSIGEEHLAALGGSLESIAMAKSGIIKHGCPVFITLPNVNLHLLGAHQLQNAVTAACTALCLRDQAHTEASAKGLAEVIRMVQPDGVLAFLVAMASDKDHLAFARQLLSGRRPELILLTEVSIAGGRSRIALASTLKEAWTKALLESGADFVDTRIMDDEKAIEDHGSCSLITSDPNKMMLASCENASIVDSVKLADQLLKSRSRDQPALIVVTGSLHVVSSLLAALHH
ncbi:Mur ligase middle domain [Musa troglodytarum]|uniref:Mur ligase middle domain n=1 Tax=Musa troglodytarum TaxID=320322 RepID=A0A9E7HY69_9LILI|nr:Mur ligase middle domain [Musa troglodytarum]